MSSNQFGSGTVVLYPYLWARQFAAGETEGRKARPVAVGFRVPRDSGDLLLLFAITTSVPGADRIAIEVPAIERRRAGLDADRRQWIIVDEYNEDVVGRSFYLEPNPPIGRFGKAFFAQVIRRFIQRRDEAAGVSRR